MTTAVGMLFGRWDHVHVTDAAGPRGGAGRGWFDHPHGFISVREAAARLGVSSQRVRQLLESGALSSHRSERASRNGMRSRVWVDAQAVATRLGGSTGTGPNFKSSRPSQTPAGLEIAEADLRDRDHWRAEALRQREANQHLLLALEDMREAQRYRDEAEKQRHAMTSSYGEAFARLQTALQHQAEAIAQFVYPTDLDEN